MSTLLASNRIASLQRHIRIAVAAEIADGWTGGILKGGCRAGREGRVAPAAGGDLVLFSRHVEVGVAM